MKFISLITAALAFAPPTYSQNTCNLTYNTEYGDPSLPLTSLACSFNNSGLVPVNYTTLGSLPAFPFVGRVYTVVGWDAPACGTCYEVTYGNTTIPILAVNTSAPYGFVVSEEVMNALTGGLPMELNLIEVTSTEVDVSFCGF